MNYPVNRTSIKLFKNVRNEVQVFVTDTDHKPVRLLGKSVTFNIVDPRNQTLVLQRDAVIVDEYRGLAQLVLQPSDTMQWDHAFYRYSVLVGRADGTQVLLYTDQDYGADGTMELVHGPVPPPIPTIVIPSSDFNIVSQGTPPQNYKLSSPYAGAASANDITGQHSAAVYLDDYSGQLWVEASLDNQPTTDNNDWFAVTTDDSVSVHSFDGVSGIVPLSFGGNYKWVRFKFLDGVQNLGSFTQILFRN